MIEGESWELQGATGAVQWTCGSLPIVGMFGIPITRQSTLMAAKGIAMGSFEDIETISTELLSYDITGSFTKIKDLEYKKISNTHLVLSTQINKDLETPSYMGGNLLSFGRTTAYKGQTPVPLQPFVRFRMMVEYGMKEPFMCLYPQTTRECLEWYGSTQTNEYLDSNTEINTKYNKITMTKTGTKQGIIRFKNGYCEITMPNINWYNTFKTRFELNYGKITIDTKNTDVTVEANRDALRLKGSINYIRKIKGSPDQNMTLDFGSYSSWQTFLN
jgi:hypothetical protein